VNLFKSEWFPALLARIFADRPEQKIWEWADDGNVFLDSSMADEAQFYRSANTPWTRRLQELCQHPFHLGHRIRKIVEMKSSQSGVTEAVLNVMRFFVKFMPRNMIYSINSVIEVGNIRLRLWKTIESWGEQVFTGDDDDLGKLKLVLLHCIIWLFGSYASGSYANKQAPFCVSDEVDEHAKIKGQTRPVDDLDSRLKNAEEGMHVIISKPKLAYDPHTGEGGTIDQQFQLGNQEIFLVPCPHCETLQELRFTGRSDDGAEEELLPDLKFSHCKNLLNEWDLERVMSEAFIKCQASGLDDEGQPICGKPIFEHHKREMVQDAPRRFNAVKKTWEVCGFLPNGRTGARWLATAKGDPEVISQHVSDLYSLKVSFGTIAKKVIQTKNDTIGRQALFNHNGGKPKKQYEVKTQISSILALRGGSQKGARPYKRGTIPLLDPPCFFLGGDVGLNYARWVVGAFDGGANLYLVDWGSELHPNAWLDVMQRAWPCAENPKRQISPGFGFVDTKYRTQEVYNVCLGMLTRLIPCAGSGHSAGRGGFAWGKFPKGLYPDEFGLISFADHNFKTELYIDRIRDSHPRLIVPSDVDVLRQGEPESLIDELCGEQLILDPKTGLFKWKGRNNHFGDCTKLICVGFRFSTRDRSAPIHEVAVD
jgi:hypothetical protein